jgi:hypothetical protein
MFQLDCSNEIKGEAELVASCSWCTDTIVIAYDQGGPPELEIVATEVAQVE